MSNPTANFAYPISSAYTEPSQSNASSSNPAATQSRQAAEEARKNRTLADFMLMLDEYEPLVWILYKKSYNLNLTLIVVARFRMK